MARCEDAGIGEPAVKIQLAAQSTNGLIVLPVCKRSPCVRYLGSQPGIPLNRSQQMPGDFVDLGPEVASFQEQVVMRVHALDVAVCFPDIFVGL